MDAGTVFQGTTHWIYLGLGVYMIVIIAVGMYFKQGIEVCDDHVLGGRNVSFIYLVGSTAATWLCAGAVLGAAGYGYMFGFQGTIYDPWAPALTLVLSGVFLVYRLRQAGYTSIVDFYDNRYGQKMSYLYIIIQMIGTISWIAGQLVAIGVIVHLTTGASYVLSVIIGTVVIVIVTYSGGLAALARVDTVNVILIIGALVLLFIGVIKGVGGWDYFVSNARVWDNLPPFTLWMLPDERGFLYYVGLFGIISYIAAWLGVGLGDLSCAILMQRALAAKTAKTASSAFVSAGLLYLGIALMPVIIGIAAFTYGLRIHPMNNEHVLIWAADHFMPSWFPVVFVIMLAGAILSTAGNSVLTNATMVGHNIYRYFRPEATTKDTLKVVRLAIPVTALACMLIAIVFPSLYKLIVFAGCIGLPTVVPALLGGLFWKKANLKGAVASWFTGVVSWIIVFALTLPYTMENNWYIVDFEKWTWADEGVWDALFFATIPAAVVCTATLIVVSLKTQKSSPAKPMLTADGQLMDDKDMFFWSKKKKETE